MKLDGVENMEDLISQLPDDILISIVARIPTKDALSTGILSKRWRYVFRFVPVFDFSCPCKGVSTCHIKASIEGVYGVLQRHFALIRSFKFRCCLTESHTHTLEQCIYSLGKLGIEKLLLRASPKGATPDFSISFSCHLLAQMPALEHFTLRNCSLQPNLKIPINSLKTLKLCKVKGPPGSLECILSNCASLCSLTIKKCKIPSKFCVCGPNLQLKCLAIHDCDELEAIEFYASNLTTLEIFSVTMVKLILNHVPMMESIYLSAMVEEVMPYVYCRLGKDVPHLKTLVLDNIENFFELSAIGLGSIDVGMGTFGFRNLKRLELSLSCMLIFNFNLFGVTLLLRGCPLLEEFHMAPLALRYSWMDEEKDVMLHSHLKNVELNGFGGTENEIKFASYILKSAVRLQLMNISWYSSWYAGFGKWTKVNYSPRPSSNSFSKVNESIEQMKHQALSKTAQVIFQQFPQNIPKQF